MERGNLARASKDRATGRRRSPDKRTVRPSIEWMIDAMTGAAAFVVNSRQDILAVNHLGRAFYAPMPESGAPVNMARFTYLDPRAKDFFTDWNRTAKECVASLRTQAGRYPFDRDLSDLVGELSTQCEEFAARWATHNVRLHRKAEKYFHHPVVGDSLCGTTDSRSQAIPVWRFSPTWRSPGHHPRRHSTSWPVVRRTRASETRPGSLIGRRRAPGPSHLSICSRRAATGVGYGASGIAPGDQGGPGPW
jgi:hypothetical protein